MVDKINNLILVGKCKLTSNGSMRLRNKTRMTKRFRFSPFLLPQLTIRNQYPEYYLQIKANNPIILTIHHRSDVI